MKIKNIIQDALSLTDAEDYSPIVNSNHHERLRLYRVDSIDLTATPVAPFTSYVLAESEDGAASQASRSAGCVPTETERRILKSSTSVSLVDEFLLRGWSKTNLNREIKA